MQGIRAIVSNISLDCLKPSYLTLKPKTLAVNYPLKRNDITPIGYYRRTLYRLRKVSGHCSNTKPFLQSLKSAGLLNYRGCRGGRNKVRTIPTLLSRDPLSTESSYRNSAGVGGIRCMTLATNTVSKATRPSNQARVLIVPDRLSQQSTNEWTGDATPSSPTLPAHHVNTTQNQNPLGGCIADALQSTLPAASTISCATNLPSTTDPLPNITTQSTQTSINPIPSAAPSVLSAPSLYLINPTSLAKPHALQHLHADLLGYGTDVAVITETWFKKHHDASLVHIEGFNIFRKDRERRRGGGVAVYVSDKLISELYVPLVSSINVDVNFETLCVKISNAFLTYYVIGVYHPPKPLYQSSALLDYLSNIIDTIANVDAKAAVILTGDFNQLGDESFKDMGLLSLVNEPTHQGHILDRLYTSQPIYNSCKVVTSTIVTAHKAIVARADNSFIADLNKSSNIISFRKRTPARNASLLSSLQYVDWSNVLSDCDIQLAFDLFYDYTLNLLNAHYPLATVTVTSRNPSFVTLAIKGMLKQKNQLMHKGQTEKANQLANCIQHKITEANATQLAAASRQGGAKAMWKKVNEVTGKEQKTHTTGLDPTLLNTHYAAISTDPHYRIPLTKDTCSGPWEPFNEQLVCHAIDKLKPTATGMDALPAWFLRLAAPSIAHPLAHLFNRSIKESYVPNQFKLACITPVPKIPQPVGCSDYRPISITPILSRVMEKLLVRSVLYPVLNTPPTSGMFNDQFAFRPSGSTTAALIAILNDLSELSQCNDYVQVIALDFSKAFDTVRHHTLMEKIAALPLPDCVYNWITCYITGRKHCTKSQGKISAALPVNASIVQGSALGPVAFIINATDLKPLTSGNRLHKYADDTYLIVPSYNAHSTEAELTHIGEWAKENNLNLNTSKSLQMIVTRSQRKATTITPPTLSGITRVSSLSILGVTIQQNLLMHEHVNNIVSAGGQALYALKVLKAHGLPQDALTDVCRATLVSKLTYASPAWYGYTNVSERQRMNAVVKRAQRWGVCNRNASTLEDIIIAADTKLFQKVLNSETHVLHVKLPPIKLHNHNLRTRTHNRTLPLNSTASSRNFITRLLFKDIF